MMAWLQIDPSGNFHVSFRYGGRKYKRSLRTKNGQLANARLARLEETIQFVDCGRIDVPDDVDMPTFLMSDGKRSRKVARIHQLTLKQLFDDFFAALPDDALEHSTIEGMKIHQRHVFRHFGETFKVQNLTRDDLQEYVNKRAKEPGQRNGKVGGNTINKELVTFGTIWRWAVDGEVLTGAFPRKRIRLPKQVAKPPFQTWEEIERQIKQDDLNDDEALALWDGLYLLHSQTDELLKFVKDDATHPFVFPMFAMAAHTGARRSELLRSQKSDFRFDRGIVLIRERKRVRGKNTTRQIPLSSSLAGIMKGWFDVDHPGGRHTFCHSEIVPRSSKQPRDPVTHDEANDHFQRTLRDSKWSRIRGWHCLRHSFISALASDGVDQRVIDEFVGHTTEEMRRRYRHLFPNVKQAAIQSVFG